MSDVRDQYEAYPYPARAPADEAERLITGSPSFPAEMDHCLWGGQRDWSQPLRVLVAGGGTGDGLVQLAQRMTDAGKPHDILYLDLSKASRAIAEQRIAARGLTHVRFETGSLLDAPAYGPFDYIDCCGVLHHLPDPVAGLRALRAALAAGGGLGFMVYAPHGRAGVYPLQAAFNRLYGHLPPRSRLKAAKKAFAAVPEGHIFRRNPHLGDHHQSDAGFYDLLVHSQDQAFGIADWCAALTEAGWSLAAMTQPGLYDLTQLIDGADRLDPIAAMQTAEDLRGTIKTHVGYARPAEEAAPPLPAWSARIPHLNNVPAAQLAQAIAAGKMPPLRVGSEQVQIKLRPDTAPLIAGIDKQRTQSQIADAAGLSGDKAARLWSRIEAALTPWGVLHYSGIGR
ncbi:class I SAM-dependent methyltransferase [Yoonia sp. R2331]|uniref:class I SAM-dependent methyltransferase n=1 Tax=Yoonia sp. R2331 TaxID=3237238 RepID=UPI0034E59861